MENAPEESDLVRRLVALKRHETPPPGYFRGFSARVIARIEHDESARSQPWWGRLGRLMEGRPALLGANALIMAGLGLLAGAAVFTHNSRPDRSARRVGQDFSPLGAGLGLGDSGSTTLLTHQPRFPAGLRYQLQIIPVDSNQVPSGLFGRPQFPVMPAGLSGWQH